MGSGFFKKAAAPKIGGSNMNLEARALGSPAYAGRAAGVERNKDLAAAMGINHGKGPLSKATGSSAYPKGPKI